MAEIPEMIAEIFIPGRPVCLTVKPVEKSTKSKKANSTDVTMQELPTTEEADDIVSSDSTRNDTSVEEEVKTKKKVKKSSSKQKSELSFLLDSKYLMFFHNIICLTG